MNNSLNMYENLNSEDIKHRSEVVTDTTATNLYKEVLDKNDKTIGAVKKIIKKEIAVFSFNESLGLGKKYYLIPIKSFGDDLKTHKLILDFDFDYIRNAPSFNENNWPEDIGSYIEKNLNYWSK
jgi:hypothetical protein